MQVASSWFPPLSVVMNLRAVFQNGARLRIAIDPQELMQKFKAKERLRTIKDALVI
jgi:hypothetical protein